jgi:hypothetical protein
MSENVIKFFTPVTLTLVTPYSTKYTAIKGFRLTIQGPIFKVKKKEYKLGK